jgi:outer membrane protein OmpA-like peptidoglycan-associated protein
LGAATTAQAQTTAKGFALDRFDPAERGSNWFALDSLDFRSEDYRPAIGLTLDYAYKPLVVYNLDGTEQSALVKHQLMAHLGGSVALFNRFRIGLNIPVALYQGGSDATINDVGYKAATSASLGDIRVGGDVRIWGETHDPFTVAAGLQLYIPSGSTAQYTGDGHIRVTPHAAVAGKIDIFVYAARLAFEYRNSDEKIDSAPTGSEFQVAASAGVQVLDDALVIGPEVYGGTVVVGGGAFEKRTTPFEVVLGAHYQLENFKFGAGIGPGLTKGFGTPAVRALGSFEWAPAYKEPPKDRDGDGITDDVDACPDVKGIASADPKLNGCPPPDRDGDGIIDSEDACPDVKGVKTKDPKTNGCPPDRDHDGVYDSVDACPDVPGVKTDDPKTNGCPPPPPDRDHDGIVDSEDACPDEPGIPELKGCPDKDTDGDGLVDRLDNCPTEKGPKENYGCPLKQKQLVVITKERLEIKDKVYFDTDKATIQKKSFGLLEQVAKVIVGHPEILHVIIEGHTDNVGKPAHNQDLSQNRAESVKSFLVSHGVQGDRLDAKGFGQDKPIDDNKTAAGRANNRRVEFRLPAVEKTETKAVESN